VGSRPNRICGNSKVPPQKLESPAFLSHSKVGREPLLFRKSKVDGYKYSKHYRTALPDSQGLKNADFAGCLQGWIVFDAGGTDRVAATGTFRTQVLLCVVRSAMYQWHSGIVIHRLPEGKFCGVWFVIWCASGTFVSLFRGR